MKISCCQSENSLECDNKSKSTDSKLPAKASGSRYMLIIIQNNANLYEIYC